MDDYGIVMVNRLAVVVDARSMTGDVIMARWDADSFDDQHVLAASWQGRPMAIGAPGRLHHTSQNPYEVRLWLTTLSIGVMIVGLAAAFLYFSRGQGQVRLWQSVPQQTPLTRRADLIGFGLFLASTVVVGSVPGNAGRFVVLAIGWTGLTAFLVSMIRELGIAWLGREERLGTSLLQTVTVSFGGLVVAVLILAFVVTSAVGVAIYALA
jgi:hypothetical protein